MELLLALFLVSGTADRVVAVVDTEPILASEVDAMVNLALVEMPTVEVDRDSLWDEFLDRIIDQKLILKKAARDTTIIIDREEIVTSVERQLDGIFTQLDSFPEQKAQLAELGLDRTTLRRILVGEARFQAAFQHLLMREGRMDPYVSPNQVRSYYDEVKDSIGIVPGYVEFSHIAFGIYPSMATQERINRKLMEVLDILARGGDFEVVAESFSEDPRSRANGGLVGWVDRGDFGPEGDEVIFSIPLWEISPPVASIDGFRVFRVERRSGDRAYVRQILLKLRMTRQDTVLVLNKANAIRDSILGGQISFADAAGAYSEDFTSAEQGGYLGIWPLAHDWPSPFDNIVPQLEAGVVSEPFIAEGAVELVHIIDKKEDRILTFEDLQGTIRDLLAAQVREEWLAEMVEDAKKEFYVEKRI